MFGLFVYLPDNNALSGSLPTVNPNILFTIAFDKNSTLESLMLTFLAS